MHRLIAENRAAIVALCKRYGVKRLDVFSSAAREDSFDEATSDADFLVECGVERKLGALEEYFGFQSELSALLGRPVDLVEPGRIKNSYLMKSINSARETVFGA